MFDVTCLDTYGEVITNLTQWDVNQTLIIKNTGLTSAPLFHFCNKNSTEALVVASTLENDIITVDIPNELLQYGIPIMAYLYAYSTLTSGKTLATIKIPVRPRPKPSEYKYVENIDVISLAVIEKKINDEIQSMEDLKAEITTKMVNIESSITAIEAELPQKIPKSEKGVANGVATLDDNGLVLSSQLPSYVDDVIEGTLSTFPAKGENGKIYVDINTNLTYRWSGSVYIEISKSLALGETASTAYPGNRGKQNAIDIANLKTRMTSAEDDINTLKTTVSTAALDITNIKNDISTIGSKIADINNDMSNIQNDLSDINNDISTIQNDITDLNDNVNNNASEIETLQSSSTSQANDISNLKTSVNGHTTDITDLKSTTNTHTSNISNLTQRTMTAESEIDNIQSDILSLQSRIEDLKNNGVVTSGCIENAIEVDGHVIYGATFCDVDENNQVFLREDGRGNYLVATTINRTVLAKDLRECISPTLENIIQRLTALESAN